MESKKKSQPSPKYPHAVNRSTYIVLSEVCRGSQYNGHHHHRTFRAVRS
jgi:hypothetical protein